MSVMVYPTTDKLIDRETQKQKLQEVLDTLQSEEPHSQGLEFYGLAGIGKSRILDEAKAQSRERGLAFAIVDFLSVRREPEKQTGALDILVRLRNQLEQRFPAPRTVSTALHAASLMEPNGLKQALTAFHAWTGDILSEQPLAVMFDSLQLCSDELFDWIGQRLIAPIAENHNNFLVILGGRRARVRESESMWPAILKAEIESLRLDPFDFGATVEHILELPGGEPYEPAAKQIYGLSIGHPYSTEALVYWLNELGVPVDRVEATREDLAQRLYEAVIHHYVLAGADEWVLPMLEVATTPRWFDAALLRELVSRFRPEVDGSQLVQYYIARISDLITLNLVEPPDGKPWYQVEPTLRRLLNTILSVLNPEEAIKLHEQVMGMREASLQSETEMKALYAVEYTYHLSQKTLIESPESLTDVLPSTLSILLQQYFKAGKEADVVQATELSDRLRRDKELQTLLPDAIRAQLIETIDHFLRPPMPEYQLGYLVVDHIPPLEFRVSWYLANQIVLPTETVRSGQRFPMEAWRSDPESTGKTAYRLYLPTRAQQHLRARREAAIQLHTDWADIPWELLHDEEEFLCLSRPLGRKPKMVREPRENPYEPGEHLRALIVGNPTSDLPGAEAEARAIAEMLTEEGADVELLLGAEATAEEFTRRLATRMYELIHFAGHGHFEEADPQGSGLVLAKDRVVLAEEVERTLSGRPFVFLSACEAGMAETEVAKVGFRGKYTEGIAISALLGGAMGCLGPMWVIDDGLAKKFALEFYCQLLAEMPIGEAVRKARHHLKEDSNLWAAWILYGDLLQRLPGHEAWARRRGVE